MVWESRGESGVIVRPNLELRRTLDCTVTLLAQRASAVKSR